MAIIEEFKRFYLNTTSWCERKDGCPLELFDKMNDDEKAIAENLLIERIDKDDDWIVQGLGYLKSKKSLEMLYNKFKKSKETLRTYTALAIYQISNDIKMLEEIIEMSKAYYTDDVNSLKTFVMIDIIICMWMSNNKIFVERMDELSKSKNYLIAYNAKRLMIKE